MTHTLESLMETWNSLFPNHALPRKQFALWIVLNGADVTHSGIVATAKKHLALNCNMTLEHMTRYASACMKNAKTAMKTQEITR